MVKILANEKSLVLSIVRKIQDEVKNEPNAERLLWVMIAEEIDGHLQEVKQK
jgi:hypothetical protein